jgi:hypothetical protein
VSNAQLCSSCVIVAAQAAGAASAITQKPHIITAAQQFARGNILQNRWSTIIRRAFLLIKIVPASGKVKVVTLAETLQDRAFP